MLRASPANQAQLSETVVALDQGDQVVRRYSISIAIPNIPDGIGFGIELDLDAIAEHPYQPHPMRIFDDAVADIRPHDARSYFNHAVVRV